MPDVWIARLTGRLPPGMREPRIVCWKSSSTPLVSVPLEWKHEGFWRDARITGWELFRNGTLHAKETYLSVIGLRPGDSARVEVRIEVHR